MTCQRATTAIYFICMKQDYIILNYIDDFAGVEAGEFSG